MKVLIALTTAFALAASSASAQCWRSEEVRITETQLTFGGEEGCDLPSVLKVDGTPMELTCYAEDGTPGQAIFAFTELSNGDLRMIGEVGTDTLKACRP